MNIGAVVFAVILAAVIVLGGLLLGDAARRRGAARADRIARRNRAAATRADRIARIREDLIEPGAVVAQLWDAERRARGPVPQPRSAGAPDSGRHHLNRPNPWAPAGMDSGVVWPAALPDPRTYAPEQHSDHLRPDPGAAWSEPSPGPSGSAGGDSAGSAGGYSGGGE